MLHDLRPVTFRYRKEVADGDDMPPYGLIAEEVVEVAPELVVYDKEGQPYSVRYHLLAPMLLNEMQKQQRRIEELEAQNSEIALLRDQVARLEERLGGEVVEVAVGEIVVSGGGISC